MVIGGGTVWDAVQYVTGAFSLVAFVVAAAVAAYTAFLKSRVEVIKSGQGKARGDTLEAMAQLLRVDKKLPTRTKEELVLALIHARMRRDLLIAGVALIIAVILAFIVTRSPSALPLNLLGEYQVKLGPNGGCNNGLRNTFPNTPALIKSDGLRPIARNECGSESPVRVSSDGKTIYAWGERGEIKIVNGTLTITYQDGNSWEKLQ